MKVKYWTYGSGTCMKMSDMNIGHLIASFHLLKNKAKRHILYLESQTDPRVVSFRTELDNISTEQFCKEIYPEYNDLRTEIVKRLHNMRGIAKTFWHLKFSGKL